MKRSLLVTTLAFAVLLASGCGRSASPAAPALPRTSQVAKAVPAAKAAPVAAKAIGTVVLKLSSLGKGYQVQATRSDVESLQVTMTGPGLGAPLTKRLSAAELKNTNTLAFENVPAGSYSVSLSAFNKLGANIGQKSTPLVVQPNVETTVSLQLKLNPTVVAGNGTVKFDFDIEDGDTIYASPAPGATPSPLATPAPSPSPAAQASAPPSDDKEAMLGVEIVSTETVKKLLILKKLSVTVKVTNHNTSESLSGEVKVQFFKKGLFAKDVKLVETLSESVQNLAPGKSREVTLLSTESATEATATVHTIVGSATAN